MKTLITFRVWNPLIAAALVFVFSPAVHAAAKKMKTEKPATLLDGKSFKGSVHETGKMLGASDTVEFKSGKFFSKGCAKYGFGETRYFAAKRKDGSVRFTADAVSQKSGTMHWDAVVFGNALDGKATWTDAHGKTRTYAVHAVRQHPSRRSLLHPFQSS
jgi:hypothetical protein